MQSVDGKFITQKLFQRTIVVKLNIKTGIKKYQMALAKQQPLKKVVRYKADHVRKSNVSGSGRWAVKSKAIRSRIDELFRYEGVGNIRLNGSFLVEVPKLTNLPVSTVVELLEMSKTTFYRVKDEPVLSMATVDRLSSLFKIYQRGMEAFEGQKPFEDWLYTKIPNLGDQRPIDLLLTENGRNAVLEAIDRVEYGVYG